MSEETKKTPQAEPAAEPKTAEQAAPEAAAEQAAPASETAEPKDAKKDGWFKKNRDLEAAKAKLEAAEQEAAQTKEKLLRMAAEKEHRSIASMMEVLIINYARDHGLSAGDDLVRERSDDKVL